MILSYPLAQISVGDAFNQLVLQVGIIGAIVIAALWLAYRVWIRSENAKIDRERSRIAEAQENTKRDGLISDLAVKAGKLEDLLRTEQKERYIAEGRVNEVSNMLRHVQDKGEQREKEWNAKLETLTKEHRESKERLAKLEEELRANKAELEKVTAERDAHKEAVDSLQREKLDKELEIERMRTLILEQENAIKALKQELDGLKTVAATTQNTTPVTEAKAEDKPA